MLYFYNHIVLNFLLRPVFAFTPPKLQDSNLTHGIHGSNLFLGFPPESLRFVLSASILHLFSLPCNRFPAAFASWKIVKIPSSARFLCGDLGDLASVIDLGFSGELYRSHMVFVLLIGSSGRILFFFQW
ncbi:hypothetical protein KSP39_PZI021399 [Platanthera zijinensis]|uniref:Uncharacterized protein n=1 Tax=Platanthera zijinensis TaxID=2320716 RepID=A0AAP0FVT8_9ASPA